MEIGNIYVQSLKSYTLSSHRAWEYHNSEEIMKLDWNEATIPPSPRVIQAVQSALLSNRLNWYPDVNNQSLIGKLAGYSKVPVSQILYFPGSDTIHEYIAKAFINAGDKVLIISPTYDNFRATVQSVGAKVDYYSLNKDFELDIAGLEKRLGVEHTSLVYIVNPNNPTGSFIRIDAIEKLVKEYTETLFVIDEAYYEFFGESAVSLISTCNNIIVTRTFSKAFALASFRVGYLISQERNVNTLKKIRNAKNTSTLAQIAAEAALDSIDYTKDYINEVISARDECFLRLSECQYLKPFKSSANFIFIKVENSEMKYELITYLENRRIFIRDYGHVKGVEQFIRITIGTRKQMNIVMENIDSFFNCIK